MVYKIVSIFLLLSIPCNATLFLCFKSVTGPKGFALKLEVAGEDWQAGTVQHRGRSIESTRITFSFFGEVKNQSDLKAGPVASNTPGRCMKAGIQRRTSFAFKE
jgi:hypothetical protein